MRLISTPSMWAGLAWRMALLLAMMGPPAAFAREAPPVLLANVLSPSVDVTQYFVSEKYDGVRAIWDGESLRFRSGRTVSAPDWFIAKLPRTPLDGELWLARGRFDALSAAVRRTQPLDSEWQQIKYLVFELPNAPGTFAERYARIQRLTEATGWPQLQATSQNRVANRAELQRQLADTVKAGGEGLMLHLADAPYVTGRSDVLLKLKPHLDAEATVIGYVPGRGKYKGHMGALKLRTDSGVEFKVGTGFSDAVRRSPPSVGSRVTYTYRDTTKNGKPRFASFLRPRHDH